MTRYEAIDPFSVFSLDRKLDILDLDGEQAAALSHRVDSPTSWCRSVSSVAGIHVSAGGEEGVDDLTICSECGVMQCGRARVIACRGELRIGGKKGPDLGEVAVFDCPNERLHVIHEPTITCDGIQGAAAPWAVGCYSL